MKNRRKDFYVHYRFIGSKVWHGLKKFKTFDGDDAIQMARDIWIDEYNFNYHLIKAKNDPAKPNGISEVRKYEFAIYEGQ
jgi:pectate lyase